MFMQQKQVSYLNLTLMTWVYSLMVIAPQALHAGIITWHGTVASSVASV